MHDTLQQHKNITILGRAAIGQLVRDRRKKIGFTIVHAASRTKGMVTAGQWSKMEHGQWAKVEQSEELRMRIGAVVGLGIRRSQTVDGVQSYRIYEGRGHVVFGALDDYVRALQGTDGLKFDTEEGRERFNHMRAKHLERVLLRVLYGFG